MEQIVLILLEGRTVMAREIAVEPRGSQEHQCPWSSHCSYLPVFSSQTSMLHSVVQGW